VIGHNYQNIGVLKNKNGYYFGPFASVGSANWTIKILQKVFLLRVCNDSLLKTEIEPVFYFKLKDAPLLV